MKRVFCLIFSLYILTLGQVANAEGIVLRNGIEMGASVSVVEESEIQSGALTFEKSCEVLRCKDAAVYGLERPIEVTYRFKQDELVSIEYDVMSNRTLEEIIDDPDACWIDAYFIMDEGINKYWDYTSDVHYAGPSGSGSSVHPDTPDDLKADISWGVYLATGEDMFGSYQEEKLPQSQKMTCVYDQYVIKNGSGSVLYTTLIIGAEAVPPVSFIMRYDLITE